VVVFVVCHSIRSIVNIYETIQYILYGSLSSWPAWIQTLTHVSHFSLVFNSSINILIYSAKDEKFRKVMLTTLGLTRFMRHTTTSRIQRRNDNSVVQRNGHHSTTLTTTVEVGENFPRSPHVMELRPVVAATTLANSSKARVVTKTTLVPNSTEDHCQRKSLVTTVVEVSGQSCKIIKDKQRSTSPVDSMDHSIPPCEECCGSCSCGETVSTTGEEEESTIMDDSHGDSGHNGQNGQYEQNGQNGQIGHNGQIGQNGHAANVQMGATKFTIATQTSANPNSDN